jgi:hypothetical protein
MAGSYNHIVEKPSGKLLVRSQALSMLECSSGDVYEALEELYGMIWFLADGDEMVVEIARENYKAGLKLSPGTDGKLPDEDDED